jgi:hypothetical protein
MLRLLFFSVFVLSAAAMRSQNYVDLIKVHHSHYSPTSYSDSTSLKRGFEEVVVDLKAPLKVNDKVVVVTGLFTEYFKLRLFSNSTHETQLYSIAPIVGVNYKLSDRWKGTLLCLPKLSSDLLKIGENDFQYGGSVLMEKKADKFKYKVGLYYNSEKSGSLFVPLLGLYYVSKNSKLEVDVVAPVWADVNYVLLPKLKMGANFRSVVRSYQLNSEIESRYVVKSVNELFVYLQFNLTQRLLIQGKAGYTVGRNHQVFNSDDKFDFALSAIKIGDERVQQNANFNNGLIFQTRLIYRLPL